MYNRVQRLDAPVKFAFIQLPMPLEIIMLLIMIGYVTWPLLY